MLPAWARLVWHSLGTATVVVAAELGALSAMGMIRWDGSFEGGQDGGWSALLTWLGFSFAIAVVGGAAVGRRAVRRPTRRDGFGARLVATLSAAAGATVAIAFAWIPARDSQPPVNVDPDLVVAMTAAAAIVIGALVALLALSVPAVAGGVSATAVWIWAAAIVSAAAGIATGQPYGAPRLGVIDAPSLVGPPWSHANFMIGMAVVVSLAVAAVARWGEGNRFGVAISGFVGPAVVAAAYVVAGPGVGSDQAYQSAPYRAALVAVGAGLGTSVLVALVGGRRGRRRGRPRAGDPPSAAADPVPLFGEIVDRSPDEPVMGQPTYAYDDAFRNWLDDIGPAPGRHNASAR